MREQDYSLRLAHGDMVIDDCWNRIGIRGDRSCERLAEHVHCRNCPVYAGAAIRLLDRYALEGNESAPAVDNPDGAEEAVGEAHLIFRIGEEWLALRTLALVEVAPAVSVHSLPHQRSPVLLGVANVRGTLVACLSLAELLGLDSAPALEAEGRRQPRMLILAAKGGPILTPVDEVEGIFPLALSAEPAAANPTSLTRDLLQWRSRSVRVLDHPALLAAAARSLA
ncbi:chemotaxis protein CheW [Pseudomonas sp. QL9]|uniref:Chemotaxis protein CheW n=1 Tax=Pseudomonas knackmussii (strain DSM 6978 / CCUG 54928 / LMG 23759 / B13) TaxID=1301098 RepID=A0A024HD55_PSEKB|nr:chemotaxis protein CheW [Pseudomonas knackmussii]CDF82514.1 chemotaxis signal transduction protein [Pseudomonas knackmussii B13]